MNDVPGRHHARGGDRRLADRISSANTARHALSFILPDYPQVVDAVGERMMRSARAFAGPSVRIRGVIYDFEGRVMFDATGDQGRDVRNSMLDA